ncbi:MAG: hypothetical protein HYT63_00410 [Candidatus Yanofskybacteria bacterium]|nr:hypothetical protein [Candidatus Yanofskybacteria bacterium]
MNEAESVKLKKIDDSTYISSRISDNEELVFCPICSSLFTSSEMKKAYQEYTRLKGEAKKEKALEDDFNVEFASEIRMFNRNHKILAAVSYSIPFGFFLTPFALGWSSYIFSFWFPIAVTVAVVMVTGNAFYAFMFTKRKDKLFQEFKAKRLEPKSVEAECLTKCLLGDLSQDTKV